MRDHFFVDSLSPRCVCFRSLQIWRRKSGDMPRTQQRGTTSPTSWKKRGSAYNNRCPLINKVFLHEMFAELGSGNVTIPCPVCLSCFHRPFSWILSAAKFAGWKKSNGGLLSSWKKSGLSTSSSPALWPKSANGRVPEPWRRVTG